jgi:hypothetical protein
LAKKRKKARRSPNRRRTSKRSSPATPASPLQQWINSPAKRALWKRINSAAVVPPLPAGGYRERADAAVLAWIDDIFRYYDIDPASPERWEQGFWFLAARAFPNFRLVGSVKTGRTKETARRAELLIAFEGSRRQRGSKYKNFLADYPATCRDAGAKTINGLKAAILKAKRERRIEREGLELYLRDCAARALGIPSPISFKSD